MAERKFSPFPVLKQPKFPVYEALYNLNAAFESIAASIERLDDKAVPAQTVKLYHMQAETLRAGLNHMITGVLLGREDKDWGHFGKQAIQIEERQKQGKKKS